MWLSAAVRAPLLYVRHSGGARRGALASPPRREAAVTPPRVHGRGPHCSAATTAAGRVPAASPPLVSPQRDSNEGSRGLPYGTREEPNGRTAYTQRRTLPPHAPFPPPRLGCNAATPPPNPPHRACALATPYAIHLANIWLAPSSSQQPSQRPSLMVGQPRRCSERAGEGCHGQLRGRATAGVWPARHCHQDWCVPGPGPVVRSFLTLADGCCAANSRDPHPNTTAELPAPCRILCVLCGCLLPSR
jgi:hypothetical protein